MRRLSYAALALALLSAACSRNATRNATTSGPLPEAPEELLSRVDVADPRGFVQLVSGFSKLEPDQWRWTASKLTVVLKTPAGAQAAGAQAAGADAAGARVAGALLELKFELPPVIVERLGPVSVRASVNGLPLSAETFAQAGSQTYRREVPAAALAEKAVVVEFATDKAIPPSADDDREFALIARRVALVDTLVGK